MERTKKTDIARRQHNFGKAFGSLDKRRGRSFANEGECRDVVED